jgi:hypothetical protein
MTESDDAVDAALKRLLVDGESPGDGTDWFARRIRETSIDRTAQILAIEEARQQFIEDMDFKHLDRPELVPFPDARTDQKIIGYRIDEEPFPSLYLHGADLSDEQYEKLRAAWFKLDPRISVIITQPMAYIPLEGPPELIYPDGTRVIVNRDPGDETDYDRDRGDYKSECLACGGSRGCLDCTCDDK